MSLYFAYGSNMSLRRIAQRTPGARPLGAALLTGYQLSFDKQGQDGSGKCHIQVQPDTNQSVWGRLYEIPDALWSALDGAEGLGHDYQRQAVALNTSQGYVLAQTYIGLRLGINLVPYTWYLHHVVTGAHEAKLPPEYIHWLRQHPRQNDDNDKRHQENMTIYPNSSGQSC